MADLYHSPPPPCAECDLPRTNNIKERKKESKQQPHNHEVQNYHSFTEQMPLVTVNIVSPKINMLSRFRAAVEVQVSLAWHRPPAQRLGKDFLENEMPNFLAAFLILTADSFRGGDRHPTGGTT